MKISFKILLAAISFTILVTTVSFLYVKSVVEIEPAVSLNGRITKNFYTENFAFIDIKRGNWQVEVIRSDSFFVQVKGGDNLVNNYVKINVVDSTLIFDIDSMIISNEFRWLNATIGMASLKRLEIDKNVSYRLKDFNEKNLDINLKSGSVSLNNCRLGNVNINASGNSELLTSKCSIEELNYTLKDSAFVLEQGAKRINCLGIDDLSVFVSYLDQDEYVIKTSEKRKELSSKMTPYVNNLRWLMPLDTVMQIMEKDTLNYRKASEEDPFLLEFLSENLIMNYYNISDKNPGIELIQLIFSRGLLSDINFKYYSFSNIETIYNDLKETFTALYGEYYKEEVPFYTRINRSNKYTLNWKAPERNLNDKYTGIHLYYDGYSWLGVNFSSPFTSLWGTSRSNTFYFADRSELRSFPNIVESFTRFFNKPARLH